MPLLTAIKKIQSALYSKVEISMEPNSILELAAILTPNPDVAAVSATGILITESTVMNTRGTPLRQHAVYYVDEVILTEGTATIHLNGWSDTLVIKHEILTDKARATAVYLQYEQNLSRLLMNKSRGNKPPKILDHIEVIGEEAWKETGYSSVWCIAEVSPDFTWVAMVDTVDGRVALINLPEMASYGVSKHFIQQANVVVLDKEYYGTSSWLHFPA